MTPYPGSPFCLESCPYARHFYPGRGGSLRDKSHVALARAEADAAGPALGAGGSERDHGDRGERSAAQPGQGPPGDEARRPEDDRSIGRDAAPAQGDGEQILPGPGGASPRDQNRAPPTGNGEAPDR